MRTYEKTNNGIEYEDEIAGINGASFILYPTAEHTPEKIKEAIREIFNNRDVVSLKVSNERDWDERYRSEIFAHPHTRSFRWYEINADDYQLLNRERRKGTTVDEYVRDYVLPFTAETKARNEQRYGDKIFNS
jgi:alpha-galactosidase/6-phospho-beta-glucosidase family protein